jgi:hypothetical protein
VQFNEILDGMTIVDQPGDDINVSPIAFDDAYKKARCAVALSDFQGVERPMKWRNLRWLLSMSR